MRLWFYILSPSYKFTFDDLWPWYMTFNCMNIQWSHIVSINHVWRSSDFNFSFFHFISLSDNLTSGDLWSWYMTFHLINKWGFPCCIYDPPLVEIHQSMWKFEPNVNLFLKALSVTLYSKLHFYPNPTFFLHIQREFHCNKLPLQQFSWK